MSGFPGDVFTFDFGAGGNLGKNLNDAYTIDNPRGHNSIGVRVTAPNGGSVSFEASFDNVNWENVSLRSIKNDEYTQTTNNNEDFIGSIAGVRKRNLRTSSAGSSNGTIIGRLFRQVATLEGIEFGWPPHRFGFSPVHKDSSFSTAQTGATLWQPASGKTYYVTDLWVIVGGTTDGVVTIFDHTDASGSRLFKGAVEVVTNKQFVHCQQLKTPFKGGAIDNILKITTSANMTIDVILHGYEV
jgi:hypothetical protein